ncbi:MAG: thioredoxin family protein [Bdellovibrionaceae bacterium]|nr:thioredoxin family protein [Pseudobdellovibrionaceae bacterium]
MALTYSPDVEIGSPMPAFKLPVVTGGDYDSTATNGKVTVVLFICNHCPYVQAIEERLIELGTKYHSNDDVEVLAICSNDPTEYPEDAPEALAATATEKSYPFPYLFDQSQSVAKAFGAVCTPDLYVYDRSGKLFYRGRLDDSWKDASKVTQKDLDSAITEALANSTPPTEQMPSMGCSIKWI